MGDMYSIPEPYQAYAHAPKRLGMGSLVPQQMLTGL